MHYQHHHPHQEIDHVSTAEEDRRHPPQDRTPEVQDRQVSEADILELIRLLKN